MMQVLRRIFEKIKWICSKIKNHRIKRKLLRNNSKRKSLCVNRSGSLTPIRLWNSHLHLWKESPRPILKIHIPYISSCLPSKYLLSSFNLKGVVCRMYYNSWFFIYLFFGRLVRTLETRVWFSLSCFFWRLFFKFVASLFGSIVDISNTGLNFF